MKKDNKEIKKDDKDIGSKQVTKNKLESSFIKKSVSKTKGTIPPVTHKSHDKPESKEEIETNKAKLQAFKDNQKAIKKLTKTHSKEILADKIISMTNNTPDTQTNVIELFDVKKSYLTGDLEYEVLKGVNLKIKLGDFVVILGPLGSGKTTLLNIISGLDKPNTGDVFVAGYKIYLY
uniref:ATP-binding cassette domain-containing protein n=1 Tax=Spiroplasma endosymbiont of Cleonymus obscurus TaxID=3066324 RepID=UPI0037DC2F65